MSEEIKGTCTEMCPEAEIILREEARLLHVLETVSGTENRRKPKADRTHMVKAFSRSAAGQTMQSPNSLRTPDALLRTLNYLLFDVITVKVLPWYVVYDFIADRLLAVRQDMVIQRLSTAHCISILQPIVRFHAYAAYRLCEEPIAHFDPAINNKNLQECLKRLLVLYDDCDRFSGRCSAVNYATINVGEYEALYANCRIHIEALYILFNLGNASAIDRALTLPQRYKTEIIDTSLRLSLGMRQGNWVRICRLMCALPPLLAGIALLHLPDIRRHALQVMTVAYSSKNLTFPVNNLQKLLLYSNQQDLLLDCKYYKITFAETSDVIHFEKGKFDNTVKTVSPRHETFADDKLCNKLIPELVLYGEII